ncbi:MAG TPA: hypothetical protein VFW73_02490 [Lacipirellulaceae bacterium]|nr:hypothetical protein [Lacipirellulaceae bacterium]
MSGCGDPVPGEVVGVVELAESTAPTVVDFGGTVLRTGGDHGAMQPLMSPAIAQAIASTIELARVNGMRSVGVSRSTYTAWEEWQM